MPVAFLYNRKIQKSDDERMFHAIMTDHNYTQRSECHQLFIMGREFGENDALLGDNSVGIIAADVEVDSTSFPGILPKRIGSVNAVLTLVHETQLPPLEGERSNVITMEWGNARLTVLDSLLACATLHSQRNTGRSAKKHAGTAQDILKREIAALAALASSGSAVGDLNASSSDSKSFFTES